MSKEFKWAKMPIQWVRDNGLRNFRKAELAASVAALKIYLAFCLHASRAPTPLVPEAGCAQLTYDDLERVTGLARATIVKGITKLEIEKLITTSFVKKRAVYQIANFEAATGWAKIPMILCRQSDNKLKDFGTRNRSHMDALKIYVLILSLRQGTSAYAAIGYDKINAHTGVLRGNIRKAISILVEFGLIIVDKRIFTEEIERNPNMYYISGLGILPRRHDSEPIEKVLAPIKI